MTLPRPLHNDLLRLCDYLSSHGADPHEIGKLRRAIEAGSPIIRKRAETAFYNADVDEHDREIRAWLGNLLDGLARWESAAKGERNWGGYREGANYEQLPGGSKRVMVVFSGDLLERLDAALGERNRSEVIREAVEDWLKAR